MALEIEPIIPPRENTVPQFGEDVLPTEHPRNKALQIIDKGGLEANRKGWKTESGYHRRSKVENTFFRWKAILGEKMYAREFEKQKTEAAVNAAVLTNLSKPRTKIGQGCLILKRDRETLGRNDIYTTKLF